jgi:hypothetical protein
MYSQDENHSPLTRAACSKLYRITEVNKQIKHVLGSGRLYGKLESSWD